ncbi:MAG TPA: N-acetylmuramoyl-L-alanine amidase-like domain-containing protein [Blastocatellia bacterium]|nr:N-acetylmuramoyl-L-alanine amidase-like domain-containing protein [Blastocatellia bacterium]
MSGRKTFHDRRTLAEVNRLLRRIGAEAAVGERMKTIARLLHGRPYRENPLVGSADSPEVFTFSLRAFDCVTYIETVLALALARSARDFLRWLRRIRYRNGRVTWRDRHHYMVEWIRANARQGVIADLTRGPMTVSRSKTLAVVAGRAPRRVRFRLFPKRMIGRIAPQMRDGDLLFFASTRKYLDVFHVGLVFVGADGITLSHAARSRGQVIEQPLEHFLRENRMAGVLWVRPRRPENRAVRRARADGAPIGRRR